MTRQEAEAEAEAQELDREDLKLAREAGTERERRQAASRLLARHQDRVYAWCYRYVEDHDRALELAQDVMLNAYRSLPQYVHRARFSSWLFVIARNRCLRDLRRPALTQALDLDPDSLHSKNPGPARRYEEAHGEERLKLLILDHLDAREQDALQLRCVEGLPLNTITEVLGIKERSGARGLLQRARRKLRVAMKEQGYE
jgi:RNA polymerase sigma-70 factor, ECF subfamily